MVYGYGVCFAVLVLVALQVGIPVDHHLLHMVERGGLMVAAVGTVAATLGEILAVRAIMKQEREKLRQQVEAAAGAAVAAIDAAAGVGQDGSEARAADSAVNGVNGAESAGLRADVEEAVCTVNASAASGRSDNSSSSGGPAAGSIPSVGAAADNSAGWRWDDGRAKEL